MPKQVTNPGVTESDRAIILIQFETRTNYVFITTQIENVEQLVCN